ncbi:protein-glutamine gamma-glutamyltransferase [Brevibacillus ginsengisoli]|uniref:protein-glutamine gamma-glutamyltransferase n=1 Tax=Brevibacillus ginsengisoli TaxID=363854 RepID=UPI003CF90940
MIHVPNATIEVNQLAKQWHLDKTGINVLNAMSKSEKVYEYENVEQLHFEVVTRTNFVKASYALNGSGAGFATLTKTKCNPQYWEKTSNGGFLLKKGVLPSTGIRDIFRQGWRYAFECGTSVIIVYYKGVLETIHEATFNQLFQNLFLFMGNYDKDLQLVSIHDQYALPGDIRYFKNPEVDPKHIDWQGENTVYLGNGMYYGHGIGITSARGIIDHLNTHRIRGAKRSAYLTDYIVRPDFKRLQATVSTGVSG